MDRWIKVAVLAAVALASQALERHLPGFEDSFREIRASLGNEPVRIQSLRSEPVPYLIELDLTRGQCVVLQIGPAGQALDKWGARQATVQGQLPAGAAFVLEPSPDASGTYHIRLGKMPFFLQPVLRKAVFWACLVGIVALLLPWRLPWRLPVSERGRKRLFVLLAVWGFCAVVLYSVIHEGSHALGGWVLGGRPNQIAWTIFSGQEPHVTFRNLPLGAAPWMSAAGVLGPTVLGLALIFLWVAFGPRMQWWLQVAVLGPGLALLTGNLGLLIDPGHTKSLAIHMGLRGMAAGFVALIPAALSLAAFAVIFLRRRVLLEWLRPPPRAS